jgi:hypothetical protein
MRCGLQNSWSLESGPLISRRVVCRGRSGPVGWVVLGTVSDAVVQRVRAKAAPCGVLSPSSRVLCSGPGVLSPSSRVLCSGPGP